MCRITTRKTLKLGLSTVFTGDNKPNTERAFCFWFQVSHHPMVVACHCEGTGWKFWADSNLKSKFWGRSIQLDPVGVLTLEFDDGEVFQWSKVRHY